MKFYTEVTIDTLYKRTWSEEAIEHAGVIWRVSEGNKCVRTLPFAFDLSLKKKPLGDTEGRLIGIDTVSSMAASSWSIHSRLWWTKLFQSGKH